MNTPAASRAAAPTATEAMVDAYLVTQRRVVEEADRFGRPNVGGLHTNTVREACRAGIVAALEAAQPASPAPLTAAPSVPEEVLILIHKYGDARADDAGSAIAIGELVLGLRRWAAALASPQVAPAPEPDLAYEQACNLATWLFNKHCAKDYAGLDLTWELCDSTRGVLSQISNMVVYLAAPMQPGAAADDARDAARLDFLIEHEGRVTASRTYVDPTLKYQCWGPNEDDDYRYLSGEHEYFNTPREAIDAAMALSTPAAKPAEEQGS